MQTQFEPTTIEDATGRNGRADALAQAWLSRALTGWKPWVGWSLGAVVAWVAAVAYGGVEPKGPSIPFIFFCLGITALYYAVLLMAMKLGAVVRRSTDEREGRIDRCTGLHNRAGLLAHGDELLDACRREQRGLSMAVIDCSDLLEVRAIYGNQVSRKLLERIVRKLEAAAGERGFAARTGVAEFTLVLPMSRDKARHAIRRVLGNPARIELDAGDSEIVLVPDIVVESASPETKSTSVLYQALSLDLAHMKENEQRRQHYLQRERERHSRPMSLPFAQDSRPRRTPRSVSMAQAATMPAPLQMS
ncbi:MAG: GGDEF domain-containing protein [Ramlibacter sp.]